MAKFEFNDVANYQPDTLAYFKSLKAKGSGAAIVKITQGTGYINPKATNQVNHADQAGLKTAGYHYAMFGGNVANAHAEARYFLAQAKARLAKGSILALDYEDAGTTGTNKAANANAIIAFMQDVKNAGFIPWFYTGKYFINAHVNHAAVNKVFPNSTWIAGYPGTSYPDFNYFPSVDGVVAWQYTNNWKSLGVDGSTLLLDWPEGGNKAKPQKPKPANKPAASSAIQQFKNAGNAFTATKTFRVDEIKKVNGIWQAINYDLAGGKKFNWTNNGIPLAILDNVTRGNSAPTKVGDKVKFMKSYASGTIDRYDSASNGVGIIEGRYGMVWYNADSLLAK